MATDYYSVLFRAVSALDPNIGPARLAIYDRARRAIADLAVTAKLPLSEIATERSALEAAIERVEAGFAHRQAARAAALRQRSVAFDAGADAAPPADNPLRTVRPFSRNAIVGVGALAVLLATALAYAVSTRGTQSTAGAVGPVVSDVASPSTKEPHGVRKVAKTVTDNGELAPGTDGGSSDGDVPYYYRRQPVFFRSTYPVGTIIIDMPQRNGSPPTPRSANFPTRPDRFRADPAIRSAPVRSISMIPAT
jgi:hypothetical protein